MRIAVDLLWVRHGISGGTESVIRNLMHGFGTYAKEYEFYFLMARDNISSFEEYRKYINFEFVECNVESKSRIKRTIWQNRKLANLVKKLGVEVYFSPIYSVPEKMPVRVVAVIHDLQALHYPEYFSKFRNLYMYKSWKNTCKNADIVITISEYCRKDIIERLNIKSEKIKTIYNPIVKTEGKISFSRILDKFSVSEKQYYYTVSSLAKHKNIITLLRAFKEVAEMDISAMLVITGIRVNAANEVIDYVKDNRLERHIIFTGFISNEERDALYAGARLFVYPSVFEGFGMPPIEAMLAGTPVLTTRKTSLEEVTMGICDYIDDPYSVEEWKEKLQFSCRIPTEEEIEILKDRYSLKIITEKYLSFFRGV